RERALANLATAQASVQMAKANMINREAELLNAQAALEVARVDHQEAERQLARAQQLHEDRLLPEQDLENARALFEQTKSRIQQAQAQIRSVEASIRSAEAQLDQAEANVKQAEAELRMADVNLHYTRITSPIDGVVIERNVDIGQTVAASLQAPTLFLIANDLSKMQVIAQIDEADIGSISERAQVQFTVDAFPGERFSGRISEIRLSSALPTTVSTTTSGGGATGNVVIYNVIIDVDNYPLKLRPSMTANVEFTVASVQDVLKVPNAALRYRPADRSPDEIRNILSSFSAAASSRPPSDSAPGRRELAGMNRPPTGLPGDPAAVVRPDRWRRDDGQATRGRRNAVPTTDNVADAASSVEEYGIQAGTKIHFPEVADEEPSWGVVWVLDENLIPQPRPVLLGITDGRDTAVVDGELRPGDMVITWEMTEDNQTPPTQNVASPFGGMRRGGRR
ncbi:MAG TPA: efflux RND transporter periplasmic adaptor subunit, partial [Acidobacteriota bacterium]|nr:efflux RND transporter periplasmic adaptor subunit [Acidobacteriota bacterium]